MHWPGTLACGGPASRSISSRLAQLRVELSPVRIPARHFRPREPQSLSIRHRPAFRKRIWTWLLPTSKRRITTTTLRRFQRVSRSAATQSRHRFSVRANRLTLAMRLGRSSIRLLRPARPTIACQPRRVTTTTLRPPAQPQPACGWPVHQGSQES